MARVHRFALRSIDGMRGGSVHWPFASGGQRSALRRFGADRLCILATARAVIMLRVERWSARVSGAPMRTQGWRTVAPDSSHTRTLRAIAA
jgi:hypothetical protein